MMDKARRTTKQQLMQLFLFFSPDFPPIVDFLQLFYFFNYIFLRTGITPDRTTKILSSNRCSMWSTENQAHSLKSVQKLRSLSSPTQKSNFEILRIVCLAKLGIGRLQFFLSDFKKNVCPNPSYVQKVTLVLGGFESGFLEGENKAKHVGAARAKLPYPPMQNHG